jgi:hypothetical protein
MSDVDDPDIGVLDKVMDPIGVSRDEAAAKFRRSCVANSEMGPACNQCGRVKDRAADAIYGGWVLSGDVLHDFAKIVPCTGVNRSVMNLAF